MTGVTRYCISWEGQKWVYNYLINIVLAADYWDCLKHLNLSIPQTGWDHRLPRQNFSTKFMTDSPMVITQGQQYNVGKKPTVILYAYVNRRAGTSEKQRQKAR